MAKISVAVRIRVEVEISVDNWNGLSTFDSLYDQDGSETRTMISSRSPIPPTWMPNASRFVMSLID